MTASAVPHGDPGRPTLRMTNPQVEPPSALLELTAEQVQRIFAAANSEPVRVLEILVDGTKGAKNRDRIRS